MNIPPITGSGQDGMITEQDLKDYLAAQPAATPLARRLADNRALTCMMSPEPALAERSPPPTSPVHPTPPRKLMRQPLPMPRLPYPHVEPAALP